MNQLSQTDQYVGKDLDTAVLTPLFSPATVDTPVYSGFVKHCFAGHKVNWFSTATRDIPVYSVL